jgi:hypothetical protein
MGCGHVKTWVIFLNVYHTYPGTESDERVRCGEGEEGIYGYGGMRPTEARRACTCRPHHGRSNDILLVVI